MAARDRLQTIMDLIASRGYLSVKELSEACHVSEVTVRRDLQRLVDEQRLQRTYGGALALAEPPDDQVETTSEPTRSPAFLTDRVDVLVATPVEARFDDILLARAAQRGVPVISESLSMGPASRTLVAVDNYAAAEELGRWAGAYVHAKFGGRAAVLDLTFGQANTLQRSAGFIAGLRSSVPQAETVLTMSAGSTAPAARQLAADALAVHPQINVIFAINDATAWGAIQACADRKLDPACILVVTFGLEGPTLRRALLEGNYCQAGLAMFPELVGPVCVEAALAAYGGRSLPERLVTPYAVLTAANLAEYYAGPDGPCQIDWDTVRAELDIPIDITNKTRRGAGSRAGRPRRIGFVVPFIEHEWYRSLMQCMRDHAAALGVELVTMDAAQMLRDDLALRQQAIAETAAAQVQSGDAVLLDGDPLNLSVAEALAGRRDVTVITNSLQVCDVLRRAPEVTLIATGGMLAPGTDSLGGPTAEAALRDLRADKMFLAVTGVSLDFGLSHANLAEVALKQAMIRAAREVILLADHTRFGQEAVGQVAPLSAVQVLVTDNALPASVRLEMGKLGINVMIART